MKKTTLLLTLGLCFGISGLAQTKKQATKRPRTATKQSAKPKQTRKAKPPTSSKAASEAVGERKRSRVKRPQRPTRTKPQRPTSNPSAVKKPGRNSISLPTAPTADKAGSVQFSAEVDSLLKATPLFKKLDTNRNGSISKRELQRLSNISKQLDISKDNKLTAVELLGNANGLTAIVHGGQQFSELSDISRNATDQKGKVNSLSESNPFGLVNIPTKTNGTPNHLSNSHIIGVILNNYEDQHPQQGDLDLNDIFTKFDTNNDNKLSTAELFGQ